MFSGLLRRIHLYLALFLAPWILMYAFSTMVMNHRVQLQKLYGGPPPAMVLEREQGYDGVFPVGATPQDVARQVLLSLDLDGSFNVNRRTGDGAYVIQRLDPMTPRRITYQPAAKKVTIERLPWDSRAYLERMHRRRGYQYGRVADNAWAVSVDLFIAAVIFWVFSGIWMWCELKNARRWGAIAIVGGIALFALFIAAI